jgi:tRNA(fMet)-specific endonuclease VapC
MSMAGSLALDTNIVSAWMSHDQGIKSQFSAQPSLLLPAIVVGELQYGAHLVSGKKQALLLTQISELLSLLPVMEINSGTASHYALVKSQLKLAGQPAPENDLWIAATCLQRGIPLVTRDEHFGAIVGLHTVRW